MGKELGVWCGGKTHCTRSALLMKSQCSGSALVYSCGGRYLRILMMCKVKMDVVYVCTNAHDRMYVRMYMYSTYTPRTTASLILFTFCYTCVDCHSCVLCLHGLYPHGPVGGLHVEASWSQG